MALGDLLLLVITLFFVLLEILQSSRPQTKNNWTYFFTITSALLYGSLFYFGDSSFLIIGELTTTIIIFIATVKQFIWYPNISKLKSYQPWIKTIAIIYLVIGFYLTKIAQISLLTIITIFAIILVIGTILLYFLLLKKE